MTASSGAPKATRGRLDRRRLTPTWLAGLLLVGGLIIGAFTVRWLGLGAIIASIATFAVAVADLWQRFDIGARIRRREPAIEHSELARLADEAEYRRLELGTSGGSTDAAQWFAANEPTLRSLLTAPSDEGAPDVRLDSFAMVADALAAWYTTTGDADGLLEVCRLRELEVGQLTERTYARWLDRYVRRECSHLTVQSRIERGTAYRISGRIDEAFRELGDVLEHESETRGSRSAALQVRCRIELALCYLASANAVLEQAEPDAHDAAADRLRDARARLDEASHRLARSDIDGEIALYLDLAAVELTQDDLDRRHATIAAGARTGSAGLSTPSRPNGGRHPIRPRLESALHHLRTAQSRAEQARDQHALAHAGELLGVLAWFDGRPREAMIRWGECVEAYARLGDDLGQARCLEHRGQVGSADPVAREVIGGQRGIDQARAAARALRAGSPIDPGASPGATLPVWLGPIRRLWRWLRYGPYDDATG